MITYYFFKQLFKQTLDFSITASVDLSYSDISSKSIIICSFLFHLSSTWVFQCYVRISTHQIYLSLRITSNLVIYDISKIKSFLNTVSKYFLSYIINNEEAKSIIRKRVKKGPIFDKLIEISSVPNMKMIFNSIHLLYF